MVISLQIPNSLSLMDVIGIAGFVVTYLAFVFGLLLVGVPMLISDQNKRLVGWLCVGCSVIVLIAGPLAWYLVAYKKWDWLVENWEALFRILFFVGYSGFFSAYYRTRHRNKLVQQADREWSVNPFRFISVSPCKCGFNFSTREISLRIEVHNSYMKSRRVWTSANVAIYRDGFARPLFTVPLPVIAIDAAANSVTEASPMWPAMMEPDQSREALTVYKSDKILRVQLVNVTTTTLADLSRDPKSVSSNPPPNIKPIAIEDVYYE